MKHKDALASILNVNSRILNNKIDSNISYLHATFKVENHVLFFVFRRNSAYDHR